MSLASSCSRVIYSWIYLLCFGPCGIKKFTSNNIAATFLPSLLSFHCILSKMTKSVVTDTWFLIHRFIFDRIVLICLLCTFSQNMNSESNSYWNQSAGHFFTKRESWIYFLVYAFYYLSILYFDSTVLYRFTWHLCLRISINCWLDLETKFKRYYLNLLINFILCSRCL